LVSHRWLIAQVEDFSANKQLPTLYHGCPWIQFFIRSFLILKYNLLASPVDPVLEGQYLPPTDLARLAQAEAGPMDKLGLGKIQRGVQANAPSFFLRVEK
jgi:hypothetical protein